MHSNFRALTLTSYLTADVSPNVTLSTRLHTRKQTLLRLLIATFVCILSPFATAQVTLQPDTNAAPALVTQTTLSTSAPSVTHANLPPMQDPSLDAIDPLTFANYDQVRVTHVDLALALDFSHTQIGGEATLTLNWLTNTHQLVLDTRALSITQVTGLPDHNQRQPLPFTLGTVHPVMGQALTIALKDGFQPRQVKISYQASREASGLQWLTPEQTQGKKQPFMFSQNQAIHARSWIPLQDTPAVRISYTATVTAPKGITVLMSADRKAVSATQTRFTMHEAIPAYLIAIAAGDLAFKPFDARSGVWAEPATLVAAANEFSDTPAMIDIAAKRYGDYRWGRYDLLILPPSFPFGGMENPRLSFITPTVIAGDKSLVSMIAHELAHSWSGNLVTNATWSDLWLNEGFTTYVENRIMEDLYGRERALMEQTIGYGELTAEMAELEDSDTVLHLDIGQRDPDDAFSSVPYYKGQLFLLFLEQRFGRQHFDEFVKSYFSHFSFQSINTATFIGYLTDNLLNKYPNIVTKTEVNSWIFEQGLPSFAYLPQTHAFDTVDAQREKWVAGTLNTDALDTHSWSVHQWLRFITKLPRANSPEYHQKLAQLQSRFDFNHTGNSEIAFAWFTLTLDCQDYSNLKELGGYLGHIGRRRLVVPLYQTLSQSSQALWAKTVFEKARASYHPLTVSSVEKLFENIPDSKD